MAEAVLFSVAQSLLKNLGSVALDEIASTWGFKTNLEKLKNTINTIKDVLLDAEEKQVESHAVRGWLDRLKSAVYAADDLFDEFATMAAEKEAMTRNRLGKEVLTFFSHSNQVAFAFNISKKIKEIREELDDIVKDSSEFAFVLRPREQGSLSRHLRDQTHSFVDVEEVVGRDDDREAIIDILMASSAVQGQRLSVIPIVGIGGMGKTTIAQLLYNDELVEKHFELKLWVCVSEIFDIKEVIKKILMSATNTQCQNLEMDQLQGQLRKEIGGKKYLLVLDDVWTEKPEEWLNLSAILKVCGEGSKILVTTRSRKVADIMGTYPTYDLEALSEEKSWTLFEKMAFKPGEAKKKPHFVKLGKEIVKKCAAVPLALITLGALLRGNDEWKWIAIAGTSFAELPDMQSIMGILKLSYSHLLSPLKNCFAYCALFPKDYEFEKETLIDLWMAEGFVVPEIENQSLVKLGEEYFETLWHRCFFQHIKTDEFGDISKFKMHDLMHDLALEVSGTKSKVASLQDSNFSDTIRHLSFGYHLTASWEIPSCMEKAKYLRTFLLPQQIRDGTDYNTAVLQRVISNFKFLRVLDLHNFGFRALPKSIGKLIHLRYLNLSMNPIEELPKAITKLRNLQTLMLYSCKRLKALPIHTSKLTNLISLNVLGCDSLTHMPPGLGELTSLHKLPHFIVRQKKYIKFYPNLATAQLRDLKTLNNLRGSLNLVIYENLDDATTHTKEANLNTKHGLSELSIRLSRHIGSADSYVDETLLEGLKPHLNLKKLDIFHYRSQKLPSWAMKDSLCMTLPNLVEICLRLFNTCLQLPSFSQLPYLRCLRLENVYAVKYMEKSLPRLQSSPPIPLPSTETFFPSLKELELKSLDTLKGWWEGTEAIACNDQLGVSLQSSHHHLLSLSFCNLTKLRIEHCSRLATFPLSPNVEELVLNNINKCFSLLKILTSSRVWDDAGPSATIPESRSKLKMLTVDKVNDLLSLPGECLSHITSLSIQDGKFSNTLRGKELKEVYKHLSSLSCLNFEYCHGLTSFPEGLEHLTSLVTLNIKCCHFLDFSREQGLNGMPWKALKSLRSLHFDELPKLWSLPSGLQYLTQLRTLMLSTNDNLEVLPEWTSCLSSLEHITVLKCPKLACLPEEFSKLTTLNELTIVECPLLTNRCRGPNGSDWPKIQNIPLLIVKGDSRD